MALSNVEKIVWPWNPGPRPLKVKWYHSID